MHKNLAKYVELLRRKDELLEITTEVSPELEISEIVDRVSKSEGGGKALLFKNTGTQFPLLINMMGSDRRMALALGLNSLEELPGEVAGLLNEMKRPRKTLSDKLSILPLLGRASKWFPRHKRGKGECQQVVFRGDEVDLSKLPILKTWFYDGGRFVTLPLVHTQDPETGVRNVGMYRMQEFDNKTTGMHWQIHKTGAMHYEKYKRLGKKMPVTVCLGGDPAYTFAATAPLPEGIDEYILAGFLRKKPVKLVKCLTNELEVPADCDFVIEGYVDPMEEKVIEGPFGDHTGFYSLKDYYPKFHITAITHRRDAIYPATLVGVPPMEDKYIADASGLIFTEPIKAVIAPEVVSMSMPWQGVAHNLAIVSINVSYVEQGIKVASALWGAGQMSFCKYIAILDANAAEPLTQRDIELFLVGEKTLACELVLQNGIADVLDHASEEVGRGGKMCIDTTSDRKIKYSIEVQFDSGVEQLDLDDRLWVLLGNTDPARDITVDKEQGILRIDARSKKLENRDFPNIVTADDKTIELVDSRWEEYGIGEFLSSPSLKYKHLLKGNGAEQQ